MREVLEEQHQYFWFANETRGIMSAAGSVAWLPLAELGASRPDHHPWEKKKDGTAWCEGTHICYTPMFWESMVDDLAHLLESSSALRKTPSTNALNERPAQMPGRIARHSGP